MDNIIGKIVNGFKIKKLIGEGKFSHVFQGINSKGEIAAIKKLKIFDNMKEKDREKCMREVQLMRKLEHPNIIKFLGSVILDNELYIITEWAEKGDLKRLIRQAKDSDRSFSEQNIWEFMDQLASGLFHMHAGRVMHRDLKPANILISKQGNLKIADLGLGRNFNTGTLEVFSKVGTPLYMSPELLRGEGYEMKSDIWSMGCILYELCELSSPFRKDKEKISLKQLFDRIVVGKYRKMSTKMYSQRLKNAIYSMILLDPTRRASAQEVVELARSELNKIKNMLKIDKSFVMEDVYFKLSLIDYKTWFLAPLNIQPLNRIFFVNEEEDYARTNKLSYFFLLSHWLLDILRDKKCGNVKATDHDASILGKEEMAKEITKKLNSSGVKFNIIFTWQNLQFGYGDEICYILNDLTTEVLIRRNFEFYEPQFMDPVQNMEEVEDEFEDLYDDVKLEEADLSDFEGDDSKTQDNLSTASTYNIQHGILANDIDPKAWYEECGKWEEELGLIEEEFERVAVENEDRAWATDLRNSKALLEDIQELDEGDKDQIFEIVEDIGTSLEKVSSWEARFNSVASEEMRLLADLKRRSQDANSQILVLGTNNKEKIRVYKELKRIEKKLGKQLEKFKDDRVEKNKGLKIKRACDELRRDIKEMTIKAEILRSILFQKDKEKKTEIRDSMLLRQSRLYKSGLFRQDDLDDRGGKFEDEEEFLEQMQEI